MASLLVNLYGGPGSGKTTLAHMLVGYIKSLGPNTTVEMVPEVAKDLVLEERTKSLRLQDYILGAQHQMIEIRNGPIDVIITDAPILNSIIYKPEHYPESFTEFVSWAAAQYTTMEIMVRRGTQPYDSVGRYHTEEEALGVDQVMWDVVREFGAPPIYEALSTLDDARRLGDLIVQRVSPGTRPVQTQRAAWSTDLP